MRTYRRGIVICLIVCLISLFVLLLDVFNVPSQLLKKFSLPLGLLAPHSSVLGFANNLFTGILSSALVVLATYLGIYELEKRKVIGLVIYYCNQYVIELSNLISLLVSISENGSLIYNWCSIKTKIETDEKLHEAAEKLLFIHDQRLLGVDGFYPILRKSKNNLQVHSLICMLAKINGAIQHMDIAYRLANNTVFQLERSELDYSEAKLKNQVDILLQTNGNNEYQQFFQLLKSVIKRTKTISVYNSDWKGKCL